MDNKPEQANVPDWIKDLDLGRTVENVLMGAVLFAGRFFVTHGHILFRPKKIESQILSIVDYKDRLKLSYVRPLIFFALSAFIAVVFSQKALGGISYVEWIFDRYPFLSSSVSAELQKFSLAKSMALMIPLIFMVALYSKINHATFNRLGKGAHFRQHLSICAYICGSLLFAESFASNFEMHLWGESDVDNWFDDAFRPIVGVTGMLIGAAWGGFAIYRFFYYSKNTFELNGWQVIAYPSIAFVLFWLSFGVLVFSIDPFLQSLE